MGTSPLFDLLDVLVSTFSAQIDPEVATVVDGDLTTSNSGTFLMVGWDDPDNDRAVSVSSAQTWAGLGAKARDETGTVTCLVVRTDGDAVADEARDAVRGVLDAVENVLRADPNLGGAVPGLQWIGFGSRIDLRQFQTEDGAVALLTFDLAYRARI